MAPHLDDDELLWEAVDVINESAAHNVAPGSETVRALIAARAAPARAAPRRPLTPLAARLLRSTSR